MTVGITRSPMAWPPPRGGGTRPARSGLILAAGPRAQAGRKFRVPERRSDGRPHAVRGQQVWQPGRVDQHVLVALVTAPPGTRAVRDERRGVTDETIRGRRGELGDDGPVLLDPGERP